MTDWAIKIPESPSLHFHGDRNDGEPMLTIRPDGKIIIGEGYELDEVARKFWDTVRTVGADIRRQAWLEAAQMASGDDRLVAAFKAKAEET